MQELVLIRGIPGTGKSTRARALWDEGRGHEWFEANHWMHGGRDEKMNDEFGNPMYDVNRLKEAHNWCQQETLHALRMGKNVVVSNTFCRVRELYPYLTIAKITGAEVKIIECEVFYNLDHRPDMTQHYLHNAVQRWEPLPDELKNQRFF